MTGKFVKTHKFHAKPTTIDNINFQSKKEANYYQVLKMAQQSGDLLFFLRQIPFDLPGGVKYRVDFVEFWKNGDIHFVDIKGMITDTYKMKKKMVEDLYPIKIEEK